MGSGCQNNNSLTKTCPTVLSSNCVKYQGPPFPQFDVCTGDLLTEDLEIILNKLADYATADGISIPTITGNCDYVTGILAGKDKNLSTLLQILFDSQCTLRELITQLQNESEEPFSFDLKCLTTPANPNRDQILQSTINQTCDNTSQITNILNQLANDTSDSDLLNAVQELIGNYLLSSINSCQNNIVKTGSGSTAQLNFIAQCPIGTILFGKYNVADFDNNGLGLASTGMCGWHIANGVGGTDDLRGFSIAGANSGIPGGALLPMVNPSVQQGNSVILDPDLVNNIGSRKGSYKFTLTINNLPSHTHAVAPFSIAHSHKIFGTAQASNAKNSQLWIEAYPNNAPAAGTPDNNNLDYHMMASTTGATVGQTSTEGGNIQINVSNTGNGTPVDNRPPTFYGMFIQRIA